jgi:hypothetical protein
MNTNKIKCNFSFQHYSEILKLAKKIGYEFCFFSRRPDKKSRKLYLRHDVDFSLEAALRLAKIDKRNGIYSTFFIRLGSPFYNLFDINQLKIVKKIIDLGHQVGLHFDERFIDSKELTQKMLEGEVVRQLKILKKYFDIKNIVSFHIPSRFIFNKNFGSNKFKSTYSPYFFSEIKYLSDSRGIWRDGCACKFLTSKDFPENLQLLTHGEWWGTKGEDPNEILICNLREKFEYLDKNFASDSQVYKSGSLYKTLRKNINGIF